MGWGEKKGGYHKVELTKRNLSDKLNGLIWEHFFLSPSLPHSFLPVCQVDDDDDVGGKDAVPPIHVNHNLFASGVENLFAITFRLENAGKEIIRLLAPPPWTRFVVVVR